MFRIQKTPAWPPALDLSTVRETIAYMEGDLRRVPGLEAAATALKTALREIETAERTMQPQSYTRLATRFLPRR
jgi:hypothetical protein